MFLTVPEAAPGEERQMTGVPQGLAYHCCLHPYDMTCDEAVVSSEVVVVGAVVVVVVGTFGEYFIVIRKTRGLTRRLE